MNTKWVLWILIALAPLPSALAQSQRTPEKIQSILRDPIPAEVLERSVLLQRPEKIAVVETKATSDGTLSLKQRLSELKDALDSGLISAVEYEEKRAALLKQF